MELPYSNVIKGNATCRGRGGWAWAGWWGGAGGDLWERRAPWPQTKNREAIAQQAQAKTMPRGNVWPGKFGKCLGSLEGVWGRASVSARPRHSSWPLRRSGLPPAELPWSLACVPWLVLLPLAVPPLLWTFRGAVPLHRCPSVEGLRCERHLDARFG